VSDAKISDEPPRKTILNNKLRFGRQKNVWEEVYVREWWDLLKPNTTAVLAVLRQVQEYAWFEFGGMER
jgi:hypothetical protein